MVNQTIETLASIHSLPANAIEAIASDNKYSLTLCRRDIIPEDQWLNLWKKFSKNNLRAQALVSRILTPTMIDACIDKVISRYDVLESYLRFNDIPKDKIESFKKRVSSISFPALDAFILGDSLSPIESRKFLEESIAPVNIRSMLLWYAFKSGAETSTEEIIDFLSTKLSVYPDPFLAFNELQHGYTYLLSRRPDVFSELMKQPTLQADKQKLLVRSGLFKQVPPSVLNAWFNALEDKDQMAVSNVYTNYANLNFLPETTPGKLEDDFMSHMIDELPFRRQASQRPYIVGTLTEVLDYTEEAASKNLQRLNIAFLRGLLSSGEVKGSEHTIARLVNPHGPSFGFEKKHFAHGGEVAGGFVKIKITKGTVGLPFIFAYRAANALMNEPTSVWVTFLSLLKDYDGLLEDLLKTSIALK